MRVFFRPRKELKKVEHVDEFSKFYKNVRILKGTVNIFTNLMDLERGQSHEIDRK